MNNVVNNVIEDLSRRIEESNAKVIREKLPIVFADAMQMEQLTLNLIGNALKFKRPDTPSVVTIKSSNVQINVQINGQKMIKLSFKDNGIGFEQKHADKIFTVFQRLHGRGQYEGTGIGLAICRKIVERHKGTITATSEPGEGTTFEVLLPHEKIKEAS